MAAPTERSDPAPTTLQREHLLASRQAAGRRSRMLVAGSAAVTLVALALLVFALISRSQAVQDKVASSAQALAVESQNDLAIDPEASVIVAMRAIEQTPRRRRCWRSGRPWKRLRSLASLPTVAAPASCDGPARLRSLFGPEPTRSPRTRAARDRRRPRSDGRGHPCSCHRSPPARTSPTTRPEPCWPSGRRLGVSLLNPTSGAVEKSCSRLGEYPVTSGRPLWATLQPEWDMLGASGDNGLQSALFE